MQPSPETRFLGSFPNTRAAHKINKTALKIENFPSWAAEIATDLGGGAGSRRRVLG